MNYNKMLNELLDNSGKMMKDIAKECQEKYGVNLTNTYLSSLKTTPDKTASDDISRAIAKACGAKYDEILVVQAYIDKAPVIIKDYLQIQQNNIEFAGETFMLYEEIKDSPAAEEIMSIVESSKRMSLAEFVCADYERYTTFTEEAQEQYLKALSEAQEKKKNKEAKWLLISPEQIKNFRLVSESDIKKLTE